MFLSEIVSILPEHFVIQVNICNCDDQSCLQNFCYRVQCSVNSESDCKNIILNNKEIRNRENAIINAARRHLTLAIVAFIESYSNDVHLNSFNCSHSRASKKHKRHVIHFLPFVENVTKFVFEP